MSTKQVNVVSDTNGDFVVDVAAPGEILAVGVIIGTLSTPDVTITDLTTGAAVFSKAGIAADTLFHPRAVYESVTAVALAAAAGPPAVDAVRGPVVCLRKLHIVVAGAGSLKAGTIYIAHR